MSTQLNSSVKRAFDILNLFDASRQQVTATVVSQELGLNGITAHRFLKTLEAVGALAPVAKGTYRLGYLLVDLGERALHHRTMAALVQPILDSVSRDLRESSLAAMFEGGMAVCIAHAEAGRWLSVDIRAGTRLEAYCTAHGKLWLSTLDAAALDQYLAGIELKSLSAHTITDFDKLRAELAKVRDQGYATNDGEREEGIRAVAVPVRSDSGRTLVTLSVFGPAARMTGPMMERALTRLRTAADDAKAALAGEYKG